MVRLLENWRKLRSRIRTAEGISLFLDYDGTLARIQPKPHQAWLDPATRRILRRLAHCPRIRIWVISGRPLAELRERVPIPRVEFLGLHGWEQRKREAREVPDSKALREARHQVANLIAGLDGVWIEDKRASFSIHFRLAVEADKTQAQAAAASTVEESAGRLQLLEGDQVAEVAPKAIHDKGVAARRYSHTFRNSLAVYAGNDATDEPAFQALASGVTIRVGRRHSTRARFSLRDPGEVRQFLEHLLEEVA
jgi:trehalose 6-phosphate phosphatase